jgi:simple sugar transport system substrate-binding protein
VAPANDINSGPGFITAENIAQVEELAGRYR